MVRPACPQDIDVLLEDGLRDQDVAELAALGLTPESALRHSLEVSQPHAFVAIVDGRVAAIGGAAAGSEPGLGHPWLLATNRILSVRRALISEARLWIDYLNSIYPVLVNAVHADNTVSINWLERMGFEFDEALVQLDSGDSFRRFHRVRSFFDSDYRRNGGRR